MINKILSHLKRRQSNQEPRTQEQLIEFVTDEKNIEKAVEGSMDKRLELIGLNNHKHTV